MNFYSQFGEDKWVWENLFKAESGKRESENARTFCEVGALDGVRFSNTKFFEELGWRGVLVEADLEMAVQCLVQRPEAVTLCCAAGSQPGLQHFNVNFDDRGLSGLEAEGYPMAVLVQRLDWLLEKAGITELDLLSIDTEGTELDVWEGLGGMKPRVVIIEHLTGAQASRAREIVERLARDGYHEVHRTLCNLILIREGIEPQRTQRTQR